MFLLYKKEEKKKKRRFKKVHSKVGSANKIVLLHNDREKFSSSDSKNCKKLNFENCTGSLLVYTFGEASIENANLVLKIKRTFLRRI